MSALQDCQLLDAEQAANAAARVRALRAHWVRRHASYPAYTLGAPSYLDGNAHDDRRYRARAAQANPLLREHFADLLERLQAAISDYVGAPAHYDDRLGLPGFHVFEAHKAFCHPIASVHVDRQYKLIRWPDGSALDEASQISATLCLDLPASGGGLRVWPVDSLALRGMASDDRLGSLRAGRGAAQLHPYRIGGLVLHSGHLFHQIAPFGAAVEGESRITLQAHALNCDGRWLIYW